MLRMNSVIRPRPMRFARKRAMAGSPLVRPWPAAQAFCPAWVVSTWPMAETWAPATVGFVAVR